jgi:hypothetical protein
MNSRGTFGERNQNTEKEEDFEAFVEKVREAIG